MNMNRREQILIVAVAGLAVVFLGRRVVDRAFRGPLRAKETQIKNLEGAVADREQQWDRVVQSRQEMETWRARGLPPDATQAQNLYMSWLVQLVDRSGLEQATVTPNLITPKAGVFDRLPFTIQSYGSMESLTRFLHDFYRADLLHQVRRIDLTPQRQDGRVRLGINLAVEALALRESDPRDKLFTDDMKESSSTRLAKADFEDYRPFAELDLFSPYVAPREQQSDSVDNAAFVYLTATLEVADEPVAWLYDRTNNRRYWLRPGQEFNVAGVSGKVLGIAVRERRATLEIDAKTWVLPLGKNLREIRPAAEANPES